MDFAFCTHKLVGFIRLFDRFVCVCVRSAGNALARHLSTCDRKSAYNSSEAAKTNTVKCNMLDMLGLVRRDGEDEDDDSESLLIPADQQQQLLSKSIDTLNDNDSAKSGQHTSNSSTQNAMDDFNTQLSLDDLAAPQSVAPQEPDRTPQLSDEYQSLATPRVNYNPPQYDNNDFDMASNN